MGKIKIKKNRIENELADIHRKVKISIGTGVLSIVLMVIFSIGFIIPTIVAFIFYKKYERESNFLSSTGKESSNINNYYKKNRAYETYRGDNYSGEFSKSGNEELFNEFMNQQEEMNGQLNYQQEQFDREFMEFSQKSVTSFDEGGFIQGPGFNLSDTMMSNMNGGF